MKFRTTLAASAALIPIALLSTPAFAQSTGSLDFDEEIVVTGATARDVAGVTSPDTSKAKAVLGQEVIARQNPGQTILDTINLVPGVSFQNNDAYGSSGGTLTIRGFDSSRISLTFDGIPLNDSGNYAIYSNQQLDPEVIEQVNVNLGSTDVDSPTASAVGGTVNYRTRTPSEEFGVKVSGSVGDFNFFRLFGMVDTGSFTPWGTRAFFSASHAENDNPFNNYGVVDKQQYNARIYQPIGDNGDFISVAGNYNENRNNFFGSLPLRNDTTQSITDSSPRVVGSGSSNRYPANSDEREYDINYPCTVNTVATPGVADFTNGCGTEFDRRYNPSNTGNIRGASRFTITNGVVLTVDPSYQYVKANGGGTTNARERLNSGLSGYIGGRPYFGMDLNGDGDLLDEVTVLTPSQTRTRRYGVIAGLRWDINDQHTVRISYTHDYANHRQTGQVGQLQVNGEPVDVFPVNDGLTDVTGAVLNKRDRQSYAILDQVAGEYRGEFGNLTVNLGLRAPFFKRDLNQYCFTTSASGFVDCFGQGDPRNATYQAANPGASPPQQRVFKYDKILPNIGMVFDVAPQVSVFASYAKGLSVPGTDNLYNSFYFAPTTAEAQPKPETTDSFDGGVRYRSGMIQGELSGWYTKYKNRSASAYDPVLDTTVYRNLGDVDKYGVDGYVSVQPDSHVTLYAFGSYLKSDIKDDVLTGVINGVQQYAPTAGKQESGSPTYSFGGTVRGTLGPVDLGLTAKRTGPRYIFDSNEATYRGTFVPAGSSVPNAVSASELIFPSKAPAYWLVNLDARVGMEWAGLNDQTFVQFNVYNLFDQFYVGGFGGGLNQSTSYSNTTGLSTYGSPGFVQVGAPRTFSATLTVGF